MIFLSWNYRRLGNLRTVGELFRLVKIKKPTAVFLMETKFHQNEMEKLRCKMGFRNLFAVDCVDRCEGLAMLWNEDINLEIQNYSRCHINATIKGTNGGSMWSLTGFYGHLNTEKRHEAWNLLRHLSSLASGPWVCVGDFNEIVEAKEQFGGLRRAKGSMEAFKETLAFCGLNDLGANGPFFT